MPVDRENLKIRAFERRWKRKGEDLCDLIAPVFADGGQSGDTITPTAGATGIKCIYHSRSSNSQLVVGGEAYLASHDLELERTSATVAITPKHKLKVRARGDKSILIFQKSIIVEDESFSPLVNVAATLVQQGFQQ